MLTHETEENQRVLKSVKGDALPLPDNPSDSVNEGRLIQTLEAKDLESPMSGRTVWNQKNGGAREDQIVSGRVSTPGGEPRRLGASRREESWFCRYHTHHQAFQRR